MTTICKELNLPSLHESVAAFILTFITKVLVCHKNRRRECRGFYIPIPLPNRMFFALNSNHMNPFTARAPEPNPATFYATKLFA